MKVALPALCVFFLYLTSSAASIGGKKANNFFSDVRQRLGQGRQRILTILAKQLSFSQSFTIF
jgi:hypothetical protein